MVHGLFLGVGCTGTPQEALKCQVLGTVTNVLREQVWSDDQELEGVDKHLRKFWEVRPRQTNPGQDRWSGYYAFAAHLGHTTLLGQGVTPCCPQDPSPPCFSSFPLLSNLTSLSPSQFCLGLTEVGMSLHCMLVSVLSAVAKCLVI